MFSEVVDLRSIFDKGPDLWKMLLADVFYVNIVFAGNIFFLLFMCIVFLKSH